MSLVVSYKNSIQKQFKNSNFKLCFYFPVSAADKAWTSKNTERRVFDPLSNLKSQQESLRVIFQPRRNRLRILSPNDNHHSRVASTRVFSGLESYLKIPKLELKIAQRKKLTIFALLLFFQRVKLLYFSQNF